MTILHVSGIVNIWAIIDLHRQIYVMCIWSSCSHHTIKMIGIDSYIDAIYQVASTLITISDSNVACLVHTIHPHTIFDIRWFRDSLPGDIFWREVQDFAFLDMSPNWVKWGLITEYFFFLELIFSSWIENIVDMIFLVHQIVASDTFFTPYEIRREPNIWGIRYIFTIKYLIWLTHTDRIRYLRWIFRHHEWIDHVGNIDIREGSIEDIFCMKSYDETQVYIFSKKYPIHVFAVFIGSELKCPTLRIMFRRNGPQSQWISKTFTFKAAT